MKKYLLTLFFFIGFFTSAQKTINNYQYAIVPVKFSWMSKDNQYRMSTITKMKLKEMGFVVFYDNEILPQEIASDRCNKVYVDIERANSFLATKLIISFSDCQNNVILKSSPGSSKKKDFNEAYQEALETAFKSLLTLNYHFSEPVDVVVEKKSEIKQNTPPEVVVDKHTVTAVKSQQSVDATANGYIVIDENTSTVKFRLSRTSNPEVFMASSQGRQGVLLKKGSDWFFEFYQDDKLVSEQTNLKL
ncbi:hypothetical protein [Flavobacterium sp.]|uniref:hypothetical protein n=1 Tax=Flavobacterium sp. TaxID=239 RepID=UPI00262290E6|nr:hypothetical protein [Flavobacterium sp.]